MVEHADGLIWVVCCCPATFPPANMPLATVRLDVMLTGDPTPDFVNEDGLPLRTEVPTTLPKLSVHAT